MSTLETLEICFRANLDGVDGQLQALVKQLGEVDGAALDSGADLARQFGDGLRSGAAAVKAASRAVAGGADFAGGTAVARNAGRALSEGFAAGIRSRSGAVSAAAKAVAQTAASKIRSVLQIHSPSKVAESFGGYFGEGFADGILGAADGVERAAAALGGLAGTGLSAQPLPVAEESATEKMVADAVERALDGVTVTVPLHVDGMKLGEASIRGINAVTRSAGRILLNL